jgi:hypothetical protein
MTIHANDIIGATQIIGESKVVTIERHSSGAGFAIAVECARPIAELQGYFPASAR